MIQPPTFTSAEAQRQYLPGELIHLGDGPAWKDLLVEIYQHRPVVDTLLVPAVAEPQIVWQISGNVICEERELGGEWSAHHSKPGDLFLTASPAPYELRWRAVDDQPLIFMHVFIGLPLLALAGREVMGEDSGLPVLRELSAVQDPVLIGMLDQLRAELVEREAASRLYVQSVAQSLAMHLVRTYRNESASSQLERQANALPAYRLRKVEMMMQEHLEQGIQIADLARVAEMSESHFSRMFKSTTGSSPMQYFIRLRMARAQQLLRETTRSVIGIGLDVGYTSASHFSQVFRKETGQTPNEYRHHPLRGKF